MFCDRVLFNAGLCGILEDMWFFRVYCVSFKQHVNHLFIYQKEKQMPDKEKDFEKGFQCLKQSFKYIVKLV